MEYKMPNAKMKSKRLFYCKSVRLEQNDGIERMLPAPARTVPGQDVVWLADLRL